MNGLMPREQNSEHQISMSTPVINPAIYLKSQSAYYLSKSNIRKKGLMLKAFQSERFSVTPWKVQKAVFYKIIRFYFFILNFFQIGRSSESPIDFVVMDTVPGNRPTDKINTQSTISRFACRILSNREEEDLNAMIFAGRQFFRICSFWQSKFNQNSTNLIPMF